MVDQKPIVIKANLLLTSFLIFLSIFLKTEIMRIKGNFMRKQQTRWDWFSRLALLWF
jgi:hypothetical protein